MKVCGAPHTNSSSEMHSYLPKDKSFYPVLHHKCNFPCNRQDFCLTRWILITVFEISNFYLSCLFFLEQNIGREKKITERLKRLCCLLTTSGKTNQDNKHLWASGTDSGWQNPYRIRNLHLNWTLKKRSRKMKSLCLLCSLQSLETMFKKARIIICILPQCPV